MDAGAAAANDEEEEDTTATPAAPPAAVSMDFKQAASVAAGGRAARGGFAMGTGLPRSASVKETIEQYPSSDESTRIRPSADHAMSEMAA